MSGVLLREFPFGRTGMIGDYADMEKINGNHDLLISFDGQMSYCPATNDWATIDTHDARTWPKWLVRAHGAYDNKGQLDNFKCEDCGHEQAHHCDLRDETYCSDCGLVVGYKTTTNARMGYYDHEAEKQFWKEEREHFEKLAEERKARDEERNRNRGPKIPVEAEIRFYYKQSGTIEVFNPLTGSMETMPRHIVADEETHNWGCDILLGHDQLIVLRVRNEQALQRFNEHYDNCVTDRGEPGHPGNCRECYRLDKRQEKAGEAFRNLRDARQEMLLRTK